MDTGCCVEDLRRVMTQRDGWRETRLMESLLSAELDDVDDNDKNWLIMLYLI